MIEIFRDCIKYSNLNIVSEHIHNFTEDSATGVYILQKVMPQSNGNMLKISMLLMTFILCGKRGRS